MIYALLAIWINQGEISIATKGEYPTFQACQTAVDNYRDMTKGQPHVYSPDMIGCQPQRILPGGTRVPANARH